MNKIGNVFKGWPWRLLKGLAVLAAIAAGVFWMRFAPVPVLAHTAARGEIVAEVMGTGTLEARVGATVSPKISGRVVELMVDQGDRVTAGDLLVRLDDEEWKQQVAIAQANVDAASAAITRLTTDKNRSVAVYDQAKKSHDRTQTLVSQNAVSRDDVDKAVETLAVAESGVSRAEAAIVEGQTELVAAEKTLQYHRARLRDMEILAPFDGLIVRRHREPGDIVAPGGLILTLISTDELWIRAWVDETEMARLAEQQSARVVFRSQPERSFPGSVARLGREADRETREFIVEVSVLELPKNWAVGQRAEVFIKADEVADAVVLPTEFLVQQPHDSGVFVLVDGHATWRPLTLGIRGRDTVEVREGLAAGDVVIMPVKQQTLLRDSQPVVIP
ncbi:efflux RND transporter periplasmic adaptor subunit [Novipirellula sp.]|uniref:efflux RND transporter periplasmic adaptor subunit n=1 Tax=Novipirellula sp. TaxID=2795430 RepID=UPI00356AD678